MCLDDCGCGSVGLFVFVMVIGWRIDEWFEKNSATESCVLVVTGTEVLVVAFAFV